MGFKIQTDIYGTKVWRSDKGVKPSYAVQIGRKEGDTWVNEYQKVKFKGGADIPNGTTIFIKNAFPTLDTWVKDGVEHKRIVWMIMDYSYPGKKETEVVETFLEMPDLPDSFAAAEEDLPF